MPSTRKAAYLIFLALAYLFFRGIGDHGLLDPVEGLNASVALNMVARRNVAVPMAGNLAYLGKTMGFWWLEALALSVFGWLEFSVRFWPALAGLGMAGASWFVGRRMEDERAGNYAAAITGTCLLTFVASQLVSPHTLYAFLVTSALAGIIYAFQDRRFFLLLHVSSALAFIVYGPAGILLPWLCLLLYAWLTEQERFLLDAFIYWPGLTATLLLCGSYLLFFHLKNPTMLTLMRYNPPAAAFGSSSSALLLLGTGFFPWLGVLPEAIKNALPTNWHFVLPSQRPNLLILIWSGVFLFFGFFSGDALSLTAAVPALAILCATHLAKAVESNDVPLLQRTVVLKIIFFSLLLFIGLPWLYYHNDRALHGTLVSVMPWTGFCFLFLFAGWHYARTRQPRKFMIHLCAVSLISLLPLAGAFDLLAEGMSVKDAGIFLRKGLEQSDVLVQYALNRPSLYFYTAKESLLVHTSAISGVMGQKTLDEPHLYRLWTEPQRIFVLIGRHQEIMTPLPQEVYNLHETRYLIVLSNRRDQEKIEGAMAAPYSE